MNIQEPGRQLISYISMIIGAASIALVVITVVICVFVYFFARAISYLLKNVFESMTVLNDMPGEQPRFSEGVHSIQLSTAKIYNLSELREKMRAAV
jgi:hypothetical protein